jgi:hypothetical protein
MARKPSSPGNPDHVRRGRLRRRTSLVTVLAFFSLGLAGCGDPDDDGGGGYVAAPLTVQLPASG